MLKFLPNFNKLMIVFLLLIVIKKECVVIFIDLDVIGFYLFIL